MDVLQTLRDRFQGAMADALGEPFRHTDPILHPSQNPKFGDYQANCAMPLAKQLGAKPRDVAQKLVDALDLSAISETKPEIAGPGFINVKLSDACLSEFAQAMIGDERLGVEKCDAPDTVVIDYSSPNVAKEMHVGHLRSTVIGDAIARTLEHLGHNVIRQNHLGDWGTQFGMLIERLEETGQSAESSVSDLNVFYQEARERFDLDPDFAARARKRVVALQSGDRQTLEHWRGLVAESKRHFNEAYDRLSITLSDRDIAGESLYNDKLASVADDVSRIGLAQDSHGALCIFVEGHEDPLMVRKSDGGFGYAASDLAAIRYRVHELRANRIIYVVDARQSDHFAKLFKAARLAGWLTDGIKAEHVRFGTILGEDGRPFKTRTGDTVKLSDLLDEAEQRALKIVREKSPDLSDVEAKQIAHIVGIGAVKYGDLSGDRIRDYVFSWPRMLAMDGNTAPYLQYAYARIRSIFRRAAREGHLPGRIVVSHDAERSLVLKLAQIDSTIRTVARKLQPHHLCGWLYDLSSAFSSFYEQCPVLRAEDESQRASRLGLCDLTSRALKQGLSLLGIDVIERM
jgi:arginyl-tRNA synthetase